MFAFRRAMVAALWLACSTSPQSVDADDEQRAWVSSCASSSHCSASVRTRPIARGYGTQLRVSRFRGGERELVFTSRHAPADDAAIEVRIDDKPVARLAPHAGYRRLKGSGTILIEREAADRLMVQMLAGKRISFNFRSMTGRQTGSSLSLGGFAKALRRIGIDSAMPVRAVAPVREIAPAPPETSASAPAARIETLVEAQKTIDDTVMATLRSRTAEDWSRFLPELLRAIDACVERTPGSGIYVTKAWPMVGDMAGVRTRNASVGWFDCIAAREGHRVERFEPVVASTERVPGEEYVLFTPASGQIPTGKCFRHERVVDDYKESVGWLSLDLCARAGARRVRP